MVIFAYIMAAMLATLMLCGSVVVVYKAGEKEMICKYGYDEEEEKR